MGDKSGAYLFLPDGEGRVRALKNPLVKVIRGDLKSYVEISSAWNVHRAFIINTSGNKFLFLNTLFTIGENIIATTKIRSSYGAIQSFQFPILR